MAHIDKEAKSEFHRTEREAAPLTTQPQRTAKQRIDDAALLNPKLGYKPVQAICTKCNREVKTDLVYHITDFTHLTVFLCSVATWPCLACFISGIPYCVKHCQKVDHRCPHCKSIIGEYAQFRLSKTLGCLPCVKK